MLLPLLGVENMSSNTQGDALVYSPFDLSGRE